MIHPFHKKALKHLSKDNILAGIVARYPAPTWQKKNNLFQSLVYEIIGQQLSGKVVKIIYGRFLDLFGGQMPKPEAVLKISDEKIRGCGCSWAKVKYLKSLAASVENKSLDLRNLSNISDEEVYAQLTAVNGIGPWTAEMFLIFSLHRPDVFSLGDLGLRTAVARLYGVPRDNLKKISKISESWKPYRSFASRYLWMSLENN